MAKHVCPRCGGTKFDVTAHVTQGWLVDENGTYVECTAQCEEVTHTPDDEDPWTCHECGYQASGAAFREAAK